MSSIDINLILDASGSMAHLTSDTVKGINAFIDEQRKDPSGDAYVTLTTFDTKDNLRYRGVDIQQVVPLTNDTYYGGHGGGTALLDAVGRAVKEYEALPLRAEKSMFVIVTDGEENASVQYKLKDVRATIERLQGAGTAFIFLGANASEWQAESMGIVAATAGIYTASATGTAAMYTNTSHNTSLIRSSAAPAATSATGLNWNTDKADGA